MSFELRPYQVNSIESLREGFRQQHKRQVLAASTGAGKSLMALHLIQQVAEKGKRAIFLCDRRVLVEQFSKHLDAHGINHGVLMASHWRWRPYEQVQIASIQTLEKMDSWPTADLIIVDEVHCVLRQSLKNILTNHPNLNVVGLTATPFNPELQNYFTSVTNVVTMEELVDDGFLTPFRVFGATQIDTTGVKVSMGEWQKDELEKRGLKVVGDVVADYIKIYTEVWGKPKPTIVFSSGVSHGTELVNKFAEHGLNFVQISYKDSDEYKYEVLAEFAKPDTDILGLVSSEILTRGFDSPKVEHVVLARPLRKSFSMHVQMCLDSETEILTKSGWKRHDSINNIDAVAAFNMENNEIIYEIPSQIVRRNIEDGELMASVSSPHLDIRVTDGHDMVWGTRDAAKNGKWKKSTAGELFNSRSDHYAIPVSGLHNFNGIDLTDAEIRFIGLFITDGGLSKKARQVMISQSAGQPQSHHTYIIDSLNGSGLRFSINIIKRKGDFSHYPDLVRYVISKGLPIKEEQKHLKGWEHLEKYLDKNISHLLDDMNIRQFSIFLEAINMGDGAKFRCPSINWIPKTMSITTGDNLIMANRLQEMCVVRGYRCNIKAVNFPNHANRKTLYMTYICKKSHACIGGWKGEKGRVRMLLSKPKNDELVWCVTTSVGNIVTRRNGKVAIVGNCGRGARPHPEKKFCVIQCNTGNWLRFEDDWDELYHNGVKTLESDADKKTRKEPTEKEKTASKCPRCKQIWPTLRTDICPTCGFKRERKSTVEAVAGEMVELTDNKIEKYPSEYKKRIYHELLGYAETKVTKEGKPYSPHWAYHKYIEIFKVAPPWNKEAIPPTKDTINWLTHLFLKKSKRR